MDVDVKSCFLKELKLLEEKYSCKVYIGCSCCNGGFYEYKDKFYPGEDEKFYPSEDDYENYFFLAK